MCSLNGRFKCASFCDLLVLSLFVIPNHGQTLTCNSSCASSPSSPCCGGDISSNTQVNCLSQGQGAVCSRTQTWTSSASSLTYGCTNGTGQSLACEGLHLIINAGSTATQITIFCERETACKDAIFEINGPQTNLVEIACGPDAAGGCLNTTVISNGDISAVNCRATGTRTSPTCEGMTIQNTGTNGKKLVVNCAGYWACGNSTLSKPITIAHANGQPQLICSMPNQAGRPPCSGDFVFEPSTSLATVVCQRGMFTTSQSVCQSMSVKGNNFNVTCEAQNNATVGPVCQNVALETTTAGLQDLTITCRATAGSAAYACSGNIALTNTFGNTAFFCDGTPQMATNICNGVRFIMTATPSGSNTANCPGGPDCTSVTQACQTGSCACIGNQQGCGSRTVETRVPTKSPSSIPSSSPTSIPSIVPSTSPSHTPSTLPSAVPTIVPSQLPSTSPSNIPSSAPSWLPSQAPTSAPSSVPSLIPSATPSITPSAAPSISPSSSPSTTPTTSMPTSYPASSQPSQNPTKNPTINPTTSQPTKNPTNYPTANPTTTQPTTTPTTNPTHHPSESPSLSPTNVPTTVPSMTPSRVPSSAPSDVPSNFPSNFPSFLPSRLPTSAPSALPTAFPTTNMPSTSQPSVIPTSNPTRNPTRNPATSSPSIRRHFEPVGETASVSLQGAPSVIDKISQQSSTPEFVSKMEQGVASATEEAIRARNVSVKIQANLTNISLSSVVRRRLLSRTISFTHDLYYANATSRGVTASEVRNATDAERATIEKNLTTIFMRIYNATNITLIVTFKTLQVPINTTATPDQSSMGLAAGVRVGIILGVLGGITLIVVCTLWYFKQKEPTPTMQQTQMAVR